ncbi:MAG: CvpA family protein [Candidatus Spyradocola sp.]
MNIIDYAIILFFGLSILLGMHRGSVATALNLLGAALSLLLARLCYPLVTEWIAGHEKWMEYLVYFSEGSSHIPTAMMEYARADVTTLTAEQVQSVVAASGFTAPYDEVLLRNIADQVYAGQCTTLFEYFDQTVADYSLNAISFLTTFAFTYLVCSLLIRLIDFTLTFPLLKCFDSVAGGVLGAARGFLGMMLLALLVPLVLNMLQIGLIEELVEGSALLKPFFPDNWFFSWIRSTI